MEKKNWAKRILALGAGALMLGATLTGALAATWNLADYPAPFVTNGQLDNTVLVVGKAADAADVLGAIDIAAALQASAVSQTTVEVSSTVAPTVSDGVKIEKSGQRFNYEEQITDVKPEALDRNDFDMLRDVTFRDTKGDNRGNTEYRQILEFGTDAGTGTFDLYQPGRSDNYPNGRDADNYLYLKRGNNLYEYTLEFKSPITVAGSTDLEGNTIEIQGNVYTITGATVSSGEVTKLTLVSGDSTIWLEQDQPYSIGSHTVTVLNVNQDGDMCGINVDGVTRWVDVGTSSTFGDLSISVLSAVAVHTRDYDKDTCELSIGSNEIILSDGDAIRVNDEELDGTLVTMLGTGNWEGFTVTYRMGQEQSGINQADIFLNAGEAWTDPVFMNWKILFEGVTADYEEMKFSASSDNGYFTFTNYGGRDVTIPFYGDGTDVYLGESADEPLLLPGDDHDDDPIGVQLLYTTPGNEAHVLEIASLTCDSTRDRISIRDVTYGNAFVTRDFELVNACDGSTETIPMGSLGSIQLDINSTYVLYNADAAYGDNTPYTEYKGELTFTANSIVFVESTDVVAADTITITLEADDDEVEFTSVVSANGLNAVNHAYRDSDTMMGRTVKGTLVTYDNKDKKEIMMMAPEKDAFANVFVAPMGAKVTTGGSEGVMADKVNPFRVGLAVLDADARAMSKNMIIVGGPCANTIAAEVMGNPANCAEGFEPGKAMIKYFDRNGRAALLVAGYSAQDTVGASYVLADYDSYSLSGDEVEVVVTSLDQITVN